MAAYTVSDVAAMARVSIRTLHHYHEIGLLLPAFTGANGYRYYGRAELLRLQQILIHRELGIPLAEIGAILDAEGFDRLTALKAQRERITRQVARSAEMLRTIDRTIAELEGDRIMKNEDLYSGIVDPDRQAEYEAWLEKTYGAELREPIETSRRRVSSLTPAEREALMAELRGIETELAEEMRKGTPPDSETLHPLIARHRAWVEANWGRSASPSAYAGLADLYLSHPDFEARFERIEPGFARFLAGAMKSWAARP
ncbi:MerR family transcriptional regulator [Aureimonas sp. SK2]|uniref:MerR family transcriptional regulator n=1 Tax=Aureimonas sp. SK2 TaxID=3015992 RepID=UPI0024439FE6|nr:MerR family transcriptional regulator [Aureimonas sp. SK2]